MIVRMPMAENFKGNHFIINNFSGWWMITGCMHTRSVAMAVLSDVIAAIFVKNAGYINYPDCSCRRASFRKEWVLWKGWGDLMEGVM